MISLDLDLARGKLPDRGVMVPVYTKRTAWRQNIKDFLETATALLGLIAIVLVAAVYGLAVPVARLMAVVESTVSGGFKRSASAAQRQ